MFNISYFTESECKGTIKFNKNNNPKYSGLGRYKDIKGQVWDINAVIGPYVCAVKLEELHPYYKNTSDFCSLSLVSQTWHPYKMEILED